jgi:hypothetical protein
LAKDSKNLREENWQTLEVLQAQLLPPELLDIAKLQKMIQQELKE